ncbi:histone-arginine methyltransferase CARM1 [Tachysurus ichikawai]
MGENQDVVQVKEDKHVEKITKDVIHKCLKHCWRIGQAERHYQLKLHTALSIWLFVPKELRHIEAGLQQKRKAE